MFVKIATPKRNHKKGMKFNPHLTYNGRNKQSKFQDNKEKIACRFKTSCSRHTHQ